MRSFPAGRILLSEDGSPPPPVLFLQPHVGLSAPLDRMRPRGPKPLSGSGMGESFFLLPTLTLCYLTMQDNVHYGGYAIAFFHSRVSFTYMSIIRHAERD